MCSANCSPDCSYGWSKEVTNWLGTRSSQFQLNNVQKTDSGEYLCTANNTQGEKRSPIITIDVICKNSFNSFL